MTNNKEIYGSIFLICVGIFVIIALSVIFFGTKYFYHPYLPTLSYNNFEFKQQDKFWHTLWQRNDKVYTISLRYNPKEVEDVPVLGVLNNTFNKRNKIYITFDPQANNSQFKYLAVSASELTINLAGPLGKNVVAACTKNFTSGCASRPIVSCDDVNENVIVVEASGEPKISLNGTCMIFSGAGLDLVKSVDKALYLWMGIIPRPQHPVSADANDVKKQRMSSSHSSAQPAAKPIPSDNKEVQQDVPEQGTDEENVPIIVSDE